MKPIHGKLLIATGIIHALFALLPSTFGRIWWGMASEGFFNTVAHSLTPPITASMEREAAFWFFIAGPMMVLIGQLVHFIEERHGFIPRIYCFEIMGLFVFGAVVMPVSGYTVLAIPQGIYLLIRQKCFRR